MAKCMYRLHACMDKLKVEVENCFLGNGNFYPLPLPLV